MKTSARPRRRRWDRSGRELKVVLGGGIAFAFGAVATILWPVAFPDDPEKTVRVYWTHDCDCVGHWMTELRAAGFAVRDFELESLSGVRARLDVPKALHGCHTGELLSYFVEGHVAPAELQRIVGERPLAKGFAYVRPSAAEHEQLYRFPMQGGPTLQDGEKETDTEQTHDI